MDIAGSRDVAIQPMDRAQFSNYGDEGTAVATGQKSADGASVLIPGGQSVQSEGEAKESPELDKEKTETLTKAMNAFMDKMNCNIKFSVHERTKRLMVQVISQKDGKVLKEFPPKEMLDVMANISESIGVILDKKA